ncbi:AraC family ligand binding domain-containing protein [Flavivirga spongiicola]|uniref:AraC family ligand binding domain-containing protein n=1 Tax=Flavivirga spongiicola TaxID=421621 RepID=A0ABU7XZ72_9FLAO|nr:AraC family ligand binding domain-containing protein [Flavivirga sp. MEBiC05379]MDO5981084.1 AraC family ligand binding domain-containing protein [Flavivirga sp. MEBiC05379]
MNTASLLDNITYQENGKPTVTVLLKTSSTKEVRIVMKTGQFMKEHTAPFPIIIELFDGSIDFGVNGKNQDLKKGDMIALDANVPHDLTCISNCIIRLSISVLDGVERIKSI